jgi:RNA polymerase sigma-70 factor (ECF subfamily)
VDDNPGGARRPIDHPTRPAVSFWGVEWMPDSCRSGVSGGDTPTLGWTKAARSGSDYGRDVIEPSSPHRLRRTYDHRMDETRSTAEGSHAAADLDPESAGWLAALETTGPERERTLAELHAMLLRIARSEVHRRSVRSQIAGPELDDIAHQAAADALLAIAGKVGEYRGDARFTTWAYKFVILEVSSKLGRHFWRHPGVSLDEDGWNRLPAAFGLEPGQVSERLDLLAAVRNVVENDLTAKQRRVFVALVLDAIPVDALALELTSTRGAIYKIMFDARRKLRAVLDANGYIDPDSVRRPPEVRTA